MEYSHQLKIPKERVPILIGKGGSVKKELEELLGVKLDIDSKEGEVTIFGEDSLKIYTAKDVVHAIGRGFNPDIAKRLLKEDYLFEVINLNDVVKTKNHLFRVKSRIIGTRGKTRSIIEDLTNTNISVFGKTVSIIGQVENLAIARRAIESLASGSQHSAVYTWLEKQRRNVIF